MSTIREVSAPAQPASKEQARDDVTRKSTPSHHLTPVDAGPITLSVDEAAALGQAYLLLDRIYRRHQAKLDGAEAVNADAQ